MKQIPDNFVVGGQRINILHPEYSHEGDEYGSCSLGEGIITIAEKFGSNKIQSEDCKVNTFYHELTHAILGTMGDELNNDEHFVNTFAGFLCEALRSAKVGYED